MDHQHGLGVHYHLTWAERVAFWSDMEAESVELGGPGFEPAHLAAQPLWWQDLPRVRPA